MTEAAQSAQSAGGDLGMIVVVFAGLAILPFVLTMVTSFAKLTIVGGILRQAMGAPQVPPSSVLTGLAIILTIHIMSPVFYAAQDDLRSIERLEALGDEELVDRAGRLAKPSAGVVTAAELRRSIEPRFIELRKTMAADLPDPAASAASAPPAPGAGDDPGAKGAGAAGSSPFDLGLSEQSLGGLRTAVHGALRSFLVRNASPRNVELFNRLHERVRAGEKPTGAMDPRLHDAVVLVPAFVLTELTEAFMIGFLIFVPFLVIELVVSSVLLTLGMQMLSPTVISLPLKLLLFVLVDGWTLILRGVVLGYS
jgi:flagellar biosynthesis protein FliP